MKSFSEAEFKGNKENEGVEDSTRATPTASKRPRRWRNMEVRFKTL